MQPSSDLVRGAPRWTAAVFRDAARPPAAGRLEIGVLPGEGIGPEVVAAALSVLSAVETGGARFEVSTGGPIGRDAEVLSGRALTEEVTAFCEGVFAGGGAVLAGPGGSRFVYDLRRRFDLFCKLSPLRPIDPLLDAGRLKNAGVAGTDILIVRENVGGEYLGEWREPPTSAGGASAITPSLRRGSRAPAARAWRLGWRPRAKGRLAVVIKDGGLPTVSALWRDLGREAAARADVELRVRRHRPDRVPDAPGPLGFDVIAASNLFGDVLADLGAVLLGSRGVSFSGNFCGEWRRRLPDQPRLGARPGAGRGEPIRSDRSLRSR